MDIADVEESLFAASDAKLHGEMCKSLSAIYCRILSIFPSLEAARPRSRSGIQALCSLHIALEKAKNLLQHCSECSKLYLAITGDSILLKFEKAKSSLCDSLRRVEDIVPQAIGCQILEIVSELENTDFLLDPLEKQIGDDIIALLQQDRKFSDGSDSNELESFHQAANKLGITSSKAALTERRALKKLIERARVEEDKRKESIVAYLLHLMRKYSKLFRSDLADDNDSQGSTPCSPTVEGSFEDAGFSGNCHAFDRQLSKFNSFNTRPNLRKSGQMLHPPDELRCPISLQIMYDPVIIASGQTYERVCIEKWFSDGHETCPKTQQKLSHLGLTPNYCVKGLINSWCEQNGVPVLDCPPASLDLNYWRLALSQTESSNLKEVKIVPIEESCTVEEDAAENVSQEEEVSELEVFDRCQHFLTILNEGGDMGEKCKVVEQVRLLLKDDEEARIFMGSNGFVDALVEFLDLAVRERNMMAQEVTAMALFNIAVNNDRNKEMMLEANLIALLEHMIANSNSHDSATALYLNLSCLERAKSVIGSSNAVPFLVGILHSDSNSQCKLDALHALYNLASKPCNISKLLSAGIVSGLQSLLAETSDQIWTEKCIAVLIYLASSKAGKEEMVATPGIISVLSAILDTGEPIEQEQAVSCLLILCNGSEKCSQMVLREGVIPALVSISVNGTTRGKEKAQKLLMLFREQRQSDQSSSSSPKNLPRAESSSKVMPAVESKPLRKSTSKRKMGKALSFFWKNKSYSVSQC